MSTNEQQQHDEQLHILQERFPQAPTGKLIRLLRRHDGNIDQVQFSHTSYALKSPLMPLMRENGGCSVVLPT